MSIVKVLMINGSPHEFGCTFTALSEVEKKLAEHEIESEIVYLGTSPIAGCIACGVCRETGKCIYDDKVNDLTARADDFDALIIGSPVYYSGPAGQICSFLDRFFYSSKTAWTGKPAAAVVSCRRGGASAAFDRLNKYFSINNMPIVTSQYWNQVHGNTPDEVRKDFEGMQTMRTLGENMAWILESLKAGKTSGVHIPYYEPKIATNFIR